MEGEWGKVGGEGGLGGVGEGSGGGFWGCEERWGWGGEIRVRRESR